MIKQPITLDDARQSLKEVEQAQRQISHARSYGQTAPYLILWGAIWIAGYLAEAYAAPDHTKIWPVLSVIGGAGSGFVAWRHRRTNSDRPHGARASLTVLVIALYAFSWPLVLQSHNPNRFGVYAGTITGAAYLIAGLWAAPLIGWLGLAITAVFLLGLLVDPAIFPIYAAFFGGGGLIAAGLLLRLKEPAND